MTSYAQKSAFAVCFTVFLITASDTSSPSATGQQMLTVHAAASTTPVLDSLPGHPLLDNEDRVPDVGDATTLHTNASVATTKFQLVGYATHPLLISAGTLAKYIASPQQGRGTESARATTDVLAPITSLGTTAVPRSIYNYYVSPIGSDTSIGTMSAPFKTLARAAKAVTKASTTVWVAPGTYNGGIKTTANGTARGRIYWVSTTKRGAKIVPPPSSSSDTAWDNRGNYVSVIGFNIDGSKLGSGTKWVLGLYTGGSHSVIADNHVHHLARTVACNSAGGSAIGVDSYYKGIMGDVIGNTVNDVGPIGCPYVQGIYHSTSGKIKNNLVYRVAHAAIHLWHDASNVEIVNNTVVASSYGIVVGGGDFYHTNGGANRVFVANNIVVNNRYGISEQGKTGTANQYINNLVYQNRKYNLSLRNGLRATGTVSKSPRFAGYSRTAVVPNFRLSLTSPAIGRGIATNAPPTDLDGRPRNAKTGYDIGAYQHK